MELGVGAEQAWDDLLGLREQGAAVDRLEGVARRRLGPEKGVVEGRVEPEVGEGCLDLLVPDAGHDVDPEREPGLRVDPGEHRKPVLHDAVPFGLDVADPLLACGLGVLAGEVPE